MTDHDDLDLLDPPPAGTTNSAPAWPDAALVGYVADRVREPREQPADSFVLHAPLELLARTALLPWVSPRSARGPPRC